MYATLSVAIVTVLLDPLLIFGFGLKAERCGDHDRHRARGLSSMWAIGIVARHHDLSTRPSRPRSDARRAPVLRHRGPGHPDQYRGARRECLLHQHHGAVRRRGHRGLRHHRPGDAGRLRRRCSPWPARSAPCSGQNWGARRFDRMRQTSSGRYSLFMIVYVRRRVAGALPHARAADDGVQRAAGRRPRSCSSSARSAASSGSSSASSSSPTPRSTILDFPCCRPSSTGAARRSA